MFQKAREFDASMREMIRDNIRDLRRGVFPLPPPPTVPVVPEAPPVPRPDMREVARGEMRKTAAVEPKVENRPQPQAPAIAPRQVPERVPTSEVSRAEFDRLLAAVGALNAEIAALRADMPEEYEEMLEFVRSVPAPQENYAFKCSFSGDTVSVVAGNAQMVGETLEAYAETSISVPSPQDDGTYVVFIKHDYGVGDADGTWNAIDMCLVADLPSETDVDGRVVSRNFILCTVTVVGTFITGLVQNRRMGDIMEYAPYLADGE